MLHTTRNISQTGIVYLLCGILVLQIDQMSRGCAHSLMQSFILYSNTVFKLKDKETLCRQNREIPPEITIFLIV